MNKQGIAQYIKGEGYYSPSLMQEIRDYMDTVGDTKIIILHNPEVDMEDEEILATGIVDIAGGYLWRTVITDEHIFQFLVPAGDIPSDTESAQAAAILEVLNSFEEAASYIPFSNMDIQIVIDTYSTYLVLMVNGDDYINGVREWPLI